MLESVSLHYTYRRRAFPNVIDGINWSVRPGQVTMLLGPNGAGKSTLLKLLSGFLRPGSGEVRLNGDTNRSALQRNVGGMPQDIQPARGMKVLEQVEYVGWLAGRSKREARAAAGEAIARVELTDKKDARTTDLSGGQLRRVGLAQALVQGGSVLLLDEPTAGLDPAQALQFRRLLQGVDCPGGVVVSTHQAADLAGGIDAVTVLADGKIRFDGTLAEFQALVADPDGGDVMARAYSQAMLRDDR